MRVKWVHVHTFRPLCGDQTNFYPLASSCRYYMIYYGLMSMEIDGKVLVVINGGMVYVDHPPIPHISTPVSLPLSLFFETNVYD